MKKDTVVFLNIFPLGKIFGESLGFELFKQNGYKLVYLDLSKMIFPETFNAFSAANKDYGVKENFFVECTEKGIVLDRIKKYARRAWLFPVPFYFNLPLEMMWIQRAFKRYQCDYILQDFFPVPIEAHMQRCDLKEYLFAKLLNHLAQLKFKSIAKKSASWLSFFLMSRDVYYKGPKFCFVSGIRSYNQFKKFYPKSKVISVPSFDYFRYRLAISKANRGRIAGIPDNPFLLYYDQSIFSSPDGRLLKFPTFKGGIFFDKINYFFDRLESVTGKKVVIAASPKRTYKGYEFGKRKVINGLTAELTYYADMAVLHTTTAYNYAAAMYKPFLFLKMKEFNESLTRDLYAVASYFNKKVLDIEEDFDLAKINGYAQVDPQVYQEHIRNFMSDTIIDDSPAQIMIKTLENDSAFS